MNTSISIPFTPLIELVRLHSRIRPNAVAILEAGRAPLDYQGLLNQIQAAAGWLAVRGIGRGDRVAISLPDGADAAVVNLGVMSNAIAAPINPRATPAELIAHLSRTGARGLITLASAMDESNPATAASQVSYEAAASKAGVPVWRLARSLAIAPFGPQFSQPATAGNEVVAATIRHFESNAERTALLLYTSGTTGEPKGVPLSEGNLIASAQRIGSGLVLSADDRCLCPMPLHHIHGLVGALLASIASGGSVVVGVNASSDAFVDAVVEFSPTWYTAVPTIHQALLAKGSDYRARAPAHKFRMIRSSSAALPLATYTALEALTGAPVIEAYGMTEASHQITSNPLPPQPRKPGSVGIAGHAPGAPVVAIVDADGQQLPVGAIGQIAIAGASVTRGYLDRADANAESFCRGQFLTGDLGRLDSDGYLFIVGRSKDIVNRGGEKIFPLEVEQVLCGDPNVAQAVVFAVPHPTLGEDLVAAVVGRPGGLLKTDSLRRALFDQLAPEKVPSQILLVDAIPVGPSGKIQRVALAKVFEPHWRPAASQSQLPEDPLQALIVTAFAQVLLVPTPSPDANFFALGGDSLSGTRVLARLSERIGRAVVPALLFRNPTAAQLASALSATGATLASVPSMVELPYADDSALAARLAAEIDALSDEEVERLLAQEQAQFQSQAQQPT